MQCYVHGDIAAVGVCKCCAKGVCGDCGIPVTNGLACSEVCKPTAEALSQLQLTTLRNATIYKAQRSVQPILSVGLIAFGVSILYADRQSPTGWVVLVLGGLLALSLVIASRRKR